MPKMKSKRALLKRVRAANLYHTRQHGTYVAAYRKLSNNKYNREWVVSCQKAENGTHYAVVPGNPGVRIVPYAAYRKGRRIRPDCTMCEYRTTCDRKHCRRTAEVRIIRY